jgi:hypothetical protein
MKGCDIMPTIEPNFVTIYLLNFGKYGVYSNRIVKRYETILNGYDSYQIGTPITDINFKQNDDINASIIVQREHDNIGNYVVVDDNGTLSRWFIMHKRRTRKGQYELQLLRDVKAENLSEVLDAPSFVEKGTILDPNNKLVYNPEMIQVNQIKTQEFPILDDTKIPWKYIYIKKNAIQYSSGNFVLEFTYNGWLDSDYNMGTMNSYEFNTSFPWDVFKILKIVDNPQQSDEITFEDYNEYILKYDNKIINFQDGYFRVNIRKYFYNGKQLRICVKLIKIKHGTFKISIGEDEAEDDGFPYICLAFPYSNDIFEVGLVDKVVEKFGKQLGDAVLDVQILPFGPDGTSSDITTVDGKFSDSYLQDGSETGHFDVDTTKRYASLENVTNNNSILINKFLFYVGDINISRTIYLDYYNITRDVLNIKKANNLYKFRLCSPSYSAVFEFNPLFIGDPIKSKTFKVNMKLMPYSPFIHVSPIFDNMYGNEFNDSRGLICSDNFSDFQTSSEWGNYITNNKNYQQIFDRQIENLEFTQKMERINQIGSLGAGMLSGAATGAVIGSIVPGIGTAVGAGIGMFGAGIAGAIDAATGNKSRNEVLDYTKDMYQMNLQNIKARPNSVSKLSSFNSQRRMCVFIEVYKCTPEEEQAFENKLKYNGMTIEVIDKIKNYIPDNVETYVKGKLIRINVDNEDDDYINYLQNEVNMGFFYTKES